MIEDLLKKAGALDIGKLLGGQKIAAMQQAIAFALQCEPTVFECLSPEPASLLADTLVRIHADGGLIVSVVAVSPERLLVVAYMPKKKEDPDGE